MYPAVIKICYIVFVAKYLKLPEFSETVLQKRTKKEIYAVKTESASEIRRQRR